LAALETEVAYWLQHDTCFNVDVTKWIFMTGLVAFRDYWRAVGIYHCPNHARQSAYASSVAAHLQRRFGSEAFRKAKARKNGLVDGSVK